jgi:hypothetical protein
MSVLIVLVYSKELNESIYMFSKQSLVHTE